MDIVTSGFLNDFVKSHELDMLELPKRFEYFCNYIIVNNENGSTEFDIDSISTGFNEQGIDGIVIIVNNRIVLSIEELKEIIKVNKYLDVKFVFIQSKTSQQFKKEDINNFLTYVKIFFDSKKEQVFNTPEIKNFIYRNNVYIKHYNPILKLYYVANANWIKDKNIQAIVDTDIEDLKRLNIFSSIEFIPCDIREVQKLYRKTIADLEVSFKFEKRVSMYSNENKEVAYCGVVPFTEFKKLIMDGDNIKHVFKNNMRDFLECDNDISNDIECTIKSDDINIFSILNNGVTIVADSIVSNGDYMTIVNYQIVNGCQTSYILYRNRYLEKINDLKIQLKIIGTENRELKNKITKATNNQTPVNKNQLKLCLHFRKNLEI